MERPDGNKSIWGVVALERTGKRSGGRRAYMRGVTPRATDDKWIYGVKRIRNLSPFGRLDGWRLACFIVKAGDDLRGEQVSRQHHRSHLSVLLLHS